ncbi:MAG: sigma-70 family RNA polymerase sigma factor [Caldilineaceae bacterium]|nr:sigma-70 family RNA polymerase sigma factor [Caldilineaceae bacterium]MBP8108337.1 sigma-70 family RNA polymerase sigma factor [Caldilineaceae bacterium]
MNSGPLTSTQPNQASSETIASEVELLERARVFDEAALGEIYDRYEERIFAYIYRRIGDPTLAEDLTAQVFLKMLEAIRKEKAWNSSFSGWLYRIAHNLVIDQYRKRGRATYMSIDDAPDLVTKEEGPAQTAERQFDADNLRKAIDRLTEEQASVISLRFLEGYSITEVATLLEKTEGAIKALQYRAVSNLRRLLEHDNE